MSSIVELQNVQKLLQIEKEEEIRQYEILIKETSVQQRIKSGACWFPVDLQQNGWGLGSHPFILIERQKMRDSPHKFRSGAVVSIFAEQYLENGSLEEKGVIHFIDKNKMKIIFYGTDLPTWVMHNRIGIQLAFDERSYQEMDKALKQVVHAKKDTRLHELREILLGYQPASFQRGHYPINVPELNDSQNEAVNQALTAQDVAILHGPPGTGKTTTLVQAIKQIAKKESTILVCAPSNPAVDLLTEKLAKVGLNVVRIGNISRVDESLLQHTVDGILDARPEMQEVKRMKVQANQLFRQADKFKKNYGQQERDEKRDILKDAKDLLHHARMLEDYIIDKILTDADVICCTLVGAMNSYIEKRTFKTVVIDESAQGLEPATWIPILKAERVILAGDPFQLPPTVKSMEAAKGGLSVTLLEKCVQRLEKVQLLDTQYRMNKLIMGFSNQMFYHNQLKADVTVADWVLPLGESLDPRPIEFVDTAGCGFEEKVNEETLSSYNPEEYFILRQHLDNLLCLLGEHVPQVSIGIISPYKEQVIFMQEQLKKDFDHFPQANIVVDTIDSFQGQERDIIYISMVRSNDKREIGFLKDTRRMNVAMTRAKKKLIIIGDSGTLASFGYYSKLIDYVEKHDAYATAWEWM